MSDPEFRALGPDHAERFREITDRAFTPEEGPREYDEPPERIAERFGVVVDDELVSVCGHYGFTARLRGEWVPLAGLAAVATPPEHRRRGHVRRTIDGSLRRWRGDFPLAALWPFDRAYYEQFGWATAAKGTKYSCPPAALAFARGTASGRARRVTVEAWERLQTAHRLWACDRTLALRREDEAWWRERVFETDEDDRPYVYAWERDGDVRGYVTYTVESTGEAFGDRRLSVGDLRFADHDAYLGLLGLLADHDSQVTEVVFYREAESTLLDLTDDPDAVDCEVLSGPMVRVVSVEHALETVPCPESVTAELTLRVTDGTAPWNDGVFRLRVADGTGACERLDGDAAGSEAIADATLDVGTLSQLVVGYHDAATARRVGELSVDGEDVLATLADLFPPETTALGTFF